MDVQQWLYSVCTHYNLDNRRVQNFHGINGATLLQMSQRDFHNYDPSNATFFYSELCRLYQEGNFTNVSQCSTAPDMGHYFDTSNDLWSAEGGANSYASCSAFPEGALSPDPIPDLDHLFLEEPTTSWSPISPATSSHPVCPSTSTHFSAYLTTTSECETSQQARHPSQHSRKQRSQTGPKLPEFLWSLLNDSNCNPSIIRWENQEEFCFRLINQHEVAKRWASWKSYMLYGVVGLVQHIICTLTGDTNYATSTTRRSVSIPFIVNFSIVLLLNKDDG
ncbi:hypothetical protein SK128_007859 [Halocaridina rubra]|uniref:PNT domain-containing protein n=1 Tax=Halocaridina rubra TaxID=373956 RepID=A0AAN8X2Q2_HALRR